MNIATTLEGQFVKLALTAPVEHWPQGRPDKQYVESLAEADGVEFLCPKCFESNGNSAVGTHLVGCWFVGKVPDWIEPNPGRWNPSGSGLQDLTFVPPGAVSVFITGGCGWHGFVKNGDAA